MTLVLEHVLTCYGTETSFVTWYKRYLVNLKTGWRFVPSVTRRIHDSETLTPNLKPVVLN